MPYQVTVTAVVELPDGVSTTTVDRYLRRSMFGMAGSYHPDEDEFSLTRAFVVSVETTKKEG